jgi:hypothetical protein
MNDFSKAAAMRKEDRRMDVWVDMGVPAVNAAMTKAGDLEATKAVTRAESHALVYTLRDRLERWFPEVVMSKTRNVREACSSLAGWAMDQQRRGRPCHHASHARVRPTHRGERSDTRRKATRAKGATAACLKSADLAESKTSTPLEGLTLVNALRERLYDLSPSVGLGAVAMGVSNEAASVMRNEMPLS